MYATIVKGKFWDFEVDIKFLTQSIVRGSINTFNAITNHFREKGGPPTIANTFFSSDIKKIICGVLRSHKDCHDTKFEVVQLWVYEVFRTFRDRMEDGQSEMEIIDIVRKETKKAFNMDFDSVCEDEENFEPPKPHILTLKLQAAKAFLTEFPSRIKEIEAEKCSNV